MSPNREGAQVVLDGTRLTVVELLTLADGEVVPTVAPEARDRAERSWRTAQRLAASGRLYGRGTGVGAQRSVPVEEDDETAHGLRLLRSHAGGAGALLPARQVRAMLAVRANQLLAGGSGIQPAFIDALADALRLGVHPAVNEYGGIGTGDLTALAQTGLTLIGERPWTRPESHGSACGAGPAGNTAAQGSGAADQGSGAAGQGYGPAGQGHAPAVQGPEAAEQGPEAAERGSGTTRRRCDGAETWESAAEAGKPGKPNSGLAEPGSAGTGTTDPKRAGSRDATGSGGLVGPTDSGVRAQPVAVSVSSAVAQPVAAVTAADSDTEPVTESVTGVAGVAGVAVGGGLHGGASPVAQAVPGMFASARPNSLAFEGSRGDGPAGPVRFVMVPAGRSADAPLDALSRAVTQGPSAHVPPAAGIPARGHVPVPVSTSVPRAAATAAGTPAPVVLRAGDALALLSSNALALGQAALAQGELEVLLRATHAVAALSLAAVSGSPEAYAAPVHALRPYPGAARAASEVRRLLGLPDEPPPRSGGRIQDPFGFRAFPQVHGCVLDACERLREVVEVEINCPSENPLMDADAAAAYHHGGFFAAPLGLALDAAVLALLQTAQLSAARLAALGDPGLTGLPPFLAAGPVSSSGTMILEYTANSALAELRSAAAPASAGHAVLSRGLEEAASFAGQAARQTLRAVDAYATVLACELVSAVRALKLHTQPPRVAALAVATAALPTDTQDRPLTDDVTTAVRLLPVLAGL
ncbi:aromatic amino acid lyase [Streptomyces rishiriensis]|uniref:aromatic amino acid lyase n=1 Tax=Streptomyces rishiriensis TaxID=68264 RepID=UPI001FE41298|nr:aromatic amino acid lyase [Streptomyces rishiriensis]